MYPNILFVNLPSTPFRFIEENFKNKTEIFQTLSMPLGILYLSSYLKSKNKNLGSVALLDYSLALQNIINYADIEDYILEESKKSITFEPDIIGISLMFSSSYPFYKSVVEILKRMWPKAITVVGGVHATNSMNSLLENKNIDYVIRGEGEMAFSELVSQYADSQPIRVRGMYSKGDIKATAVLELAEYIDNLDNLPFPDWDLLDMKAYYDALGRRRPMGESAQKRMASIMTTRGCPFRCTFCSAHTVHGRQVRFRSTENIIQEMKTLYKRYKINLFIIEDDLFTVDQKRLVATLNAIKGLNIANMELQFPNNLHINTTTEEIIDALIQCGTNIFTFAVESGSEYVQKNIIKKNCNLEKARYLVSLCHKKGVIARCCFVIGFPNESKELLKETYDYMKTLDADWCVISIATPLVGSEMYQQFLEKGYFQDDEKIWAETFFTERNFDTEEISSRELNEFRYRTNLDVNFVNNVNLRNGNFDRVISLFEDILHVYPYHIFALYGLHAAYKGKKEFGKADEIINKIHYLISTDIRAKEMYEKYSDLLPIKFSK